MNVDLSVKDGMERAASTLVTNPISSLLVCLPGITYAVHNNLPFFRFFHISDHILASLTATTFFNWLALCDFMIIIPEVLVVMVHFHSCHLWLMKTQELW